MDLLKTLLLYMSMVYASSMQHVPEATIPPAVPSETPVVAMATASPTPAPTPSPTPVPTPAITPNTDYKTIRVKDSGEKVEALQRRLKELGYYTGEIDGRFGNQTRSAVERFQYQNGLSADGIAGERTQTVLYESKDVRSAPATATPEAAARETPAPSAADAPTLARTLSPDASTPAPTFVPTPAPEEEASVDAPQPDPTEEIDLISTDEADGKALGIQPEGLPPETTAEAPSASTSPLSQSTDSPSETEPANTDTPQIPILQEGYTILLSGQQEPLSHSSTEGQTSILPMATQDGIVLMPLLRILEAAGVILLPEETDTKAEYAFALEQDLFRLTYTLDSDGQPANLALYKNAQPQVMPNRMALLQDHLLYLPMADIERVTGITCVLDEAAKTYTITLPGAEE